jgi:hypothetical protein
MERTSTPILTHPFIVFSATILAKITPNELGRITETILPIL